MALTLYQRIAEDLVRKVTSGEYPVGSILPTELELMDCYTASRNTVRMALRQLQDLGLISRRRNRGTMVEASPVAGAFTQSLSTLEDLVSLAQTAQRQIHSSEELVLDISMARELGCQPGSRWIHIAMTRREMDATRPLAWTDAFIDPHYRGLHQLAGQHPDQLLCDLIETSYGRRISTVDQTVSGCLVSGNVANWLEVEEGSPGLKILRRYRDPARAIVLVTRSVYPADRYSLTTTLTRTK